MPSRTMAIWAGVTGAVIVVAGAAAAYWTHPDLLWPVVPPPVATAEPSAASPPPTATVAPAVAVAAAKTTPAPPPAAIKPAFDVVNVEPTGEAVVAGRAAPNAKVELRDDGKTVAEATANGEGQFVIIPPALPPGQHSLTLAAPGESAAQTSNTIEVAVAAPETKSVAAKPTQAKAATAASSSGLPPPAETPSGSPDRVAVQSVEASAGGRLVAKGAASPNATVRLYLSGAFVGDAKTNADGRWTLTIKHGLTPGGYALRADAINPKDFSGPRQGGGSLRLLNILVDAPAVGRPPGGGRGFRGRAVAGRRRRRRDLDGSRRARQHPLGRKPEILWRWLAL